MSLRRSNRKRASTTQLPAQAARVKKNKSPTGSSANGPTSAVHQRRAQPPDMTPARLLLLEAKRVAAINKGRTGVMDIILDAMSPANSAQDEPLDELDSHSRQHRFLVPEPQRCIFKDLTSLDVYWQEQSAFLLGVAAVDEDDWSGLMTLANVSAERSTVGWSDDSGTSRSVSRAASDV
jgi:hypothetical protein